METETQRYRAVFRVFIDYLDAFPVQQRHQGMFFWQAAGQPRRGRNYTAVALQAIQARQLQLGLLPADQTNAWEPCALAACLARFERHFDVVSAVYPPSAASSAEGDRRAGTAQIVLRHRACPDYPLTLRFLKKVAGVTNEHVYLVDNDGHSAPVKKCKRITLFDLPFVTNTVALSSKHPQLLRKRPREKNNAGTVLINHPSPLWPPAPVDAADKRLCRLPPHGGSP